MYIRLFFLLLTFESGYLKNAEASAERHPEVYDDTEESAVIALARYLRDHCDDVKNAIAIESPLGPHKNYRALSPEDQEAFNHLVYSRLFNDASSVLPFTEGALIAAFMNIIHMDELDEHPHLEGYRHLGISDEQIETAQQLLQENVTTIRDRARQEFALISPPSARTRDKRMQLLGSEIIALFQREIGIDTQKALEVLSHLQRLHEKAVYPWQETAGASANTTLTMASPPPTLHDFLNFYEEPQQSIEALRAQYNWLHYASIGVGGLAIATFAASFFKSSKE